MINPLGDLTWLEIGSGDFPTDGYAHLDINNRAPHLEIHADALSIPLPDNSVDRILSIHLIEHFHHYDVIKLLREWWRVLAPGGEIEIHTPDFYEVSAKFAAEVSLSSKMKLEGILFGQDSDHKTMFDFQLLSSCMVAAGFIDVSRIPNDVLDRHDKGWTDVIEPGWSLKVWGGKE